MTPEAIAQLRQDFEAHNPDLNFQEDANHPGHYWSEVTARRWQGWLGHAQAASALPQNLGLVAVVEENALDDDPFAARIRYVHNPVPIGAELHWSHPEPTEITVNNAPTLTQAAADVLAERKRQIEQEGWTPEHDSAHRDGSLSQAAACYASNAATWLGMVQSGAKNLMDAGRYAELSPLRLRWPWAAEWWKPKTPRRDLVRAGALILAEIERLDRAAATQESGDRTL